MDPYTRLDTILFILSSFGYGSASQIEYYTVQQVIEQLTGKYASYAEISDAQRFI